MPRFHWIAAAGLIIATATAGAQNRRFPQNQFAAHIAYPNHVSVSQLNADVVNYYNKWKLDYLRSSNGVTPGGGYYINMKGTGGSGTEITTSEAMGYGMIVMALMAGQDANAKVYFDGLFNMYRQHPSTGNPNLMSWVIDSTELRSKDSDAATDGDLDAAYALLLADKQWGSAGAVNYKAEAVRIIQNGILAREVNPNNLRTMLGDWWDSSWANASRPSDWMTGHMASFYRATGDARWLNLRNNTFSMIQTIQNNYSPATGLLPDFVNGTSVAPAAANLLEGTHDGDYDYNACRVPLRLIVDYAHNNSPEVQASLGKMMSFFYGKTAGDPMKIMPGYKLSGATYANYQDSSFIAPVVVAATMNANYRPLANRGWDYIKAQHTEYYADSITMLAMLYASGNWWSPDSGATSTTPPPVSAPSPTPTPAPAVSPTPTPVPSPIVAPTPTPATSPILVSGNVVSNPGFESKLIHWESWGGTGSVISSGLQRSGLYALRVSGGGGGRAQNVMSRLKIGAVYKLSAYARQSSAKDPTYIGIQFTNANGKILLDKSVSVNSTNYAPYSLSVTVPTNATQAWVYIWKDAGSRSSVDLDDVSLAP